MSELWQDFVSYLPFSVVNAITATAYLATGLFLFLPGWLLTCKIQRNWARVLFRSGLVAVAFAPALTMEPGGIVLLVPASLGAILFLGATWFLYLPPGLDFYFYHTLVSMLLVWCAGIIVGEVSLRKKKRREQIAAPEHNRAP